MLSNRVIEKTVVLILSLVVPCMSMLAEESHVVSIGQLHQQLAAAAHTRQVNVAKAEKFLSSEPAQRALRTAKIDSAKLQSAMALLSDEELARLATLTDKAQADYVAGALSNQEITYILIALVTALIVLLIVAR